MDMYSDKRVSIAPRLWLIALIAAVALLAGYLIVSARSSSMTERVGAAIREVIEKSARQCYVVEGIYPPDLAYLQDNYGLQINTNDYYVTYDIFASNQPPSVRVTPKQ